VRCIAPGWIWVDIDPYSLALALGLLLSTALPDYTLSDALHVLSFARHCWQLQARSFWITAHFHHIASIHV
jgi:hypothetical protein